MHLTSRKPHQGLRSNVGLALQGFWDAMTLLSQHRRDDTSFTGAPVRTKSVAPTLAKLHAQKVAAQAAAAGSPASAPPSAVTAPG